MGKKTTKSSKKAEEAKSSRKNGPKAVGCETPSAKKSKKSPKSKAAEEAAEKEAKEAAEKPKPLDSLEESLKWLKTCGSRLDEKPHPDKPHRVGARGESRDAITQRELTIFGLLRIRAKNGRLRNLLLNRAQLDLERHCTKRNIVLKARQLGVTTYVAARFFLNTILREGTLSVQVAHDQRSAEEIFRIVHRFLENLPESLRQGALVTSRANVRQIVFPLLDSEYRVETAADPHAGRGLTIHNLHCSEVSRWPRDVEETLASLRAAVPPDGEIFLESTPNGAGGVFYDEWQNALQTGYTRHFFPWWWDPSYRRPVEIVSFTEEELELMERHGLDAAQIAFRREARVNFRNRAREEFAEDPESCFLASGDSVFDVEIIQQRLRQPSPIIETADQGRLVKFFPAVPAVNGAAAKQYIIGVDPAGGGTEGDYCCAEVIEQNSGTQCAELHGHFPPAELAARVAKLAREYNEALVAVERNNHGYAVLADLSVDQGYTNLYTSGGQAGWLTNVATRPRMLENLATLLSQAPFLFLSPRLLEECRSFVRHADGTCSAAVGAHDDTVMAMAIAQQVRTEVRIKPARSADEVRCSLLQTA